MGGEILVLGIVGMMTWLIPFFGLPIPLIGLVWGIVVLRKKPARIWLVRSGVILCSLGLALSTFYSVISVLNPPGGDLVSDFPSDYEYTPPDIIEPGSVSWQADGVIEEGEYYDMDVVSETVTLYWNSDGEYVYIGMQVVTTGWVAFGIQPDPRNERDVDMILGYVSGNDNDTFFDLFSPDRSVFNARDTALNGTDDILDSGATEFMGENADDDEEELTYTVIEFKRAYDTGDVNDHALYSGNNAIVWSYGAEDSRDTQPVEREFTFISLE
jgi:hypothetical protein